MLIRLPHRPWIHAGRPIPGTTLVKSLCGGIKGTLEGDILLINRAEASDVDTHCIKCVWLTQVWLHEWEAPAVVIPPDASLPRRTVELYIRYQDCRAVADHLKSEGYMLPNGNNIQPTDISTLLAIEAPDITPDVQGHANELFTDNFNKVMGWHN